MEKVVRLKTLERILSENYHSDAGDSIRFSRPYGCITNRMKYIFGDDVIITDRKLQNPDYDYRVVHPTTCLIKESWIEKCPIDACFQELLEEL